MFHKGIIHLNIKDFLLIAGRDAVLLLQFFKPPTIR